MRIEKLISAINYCYVRFSVFPACILKNTGRNIPLSFLIRTVYLSYLIAARN